MNITEKQYIPIDTDNGSNSDYISENDDRNLDHFNNQSIYLTNETESNNDIHNMPLNGKTLKGISVNL